MLNGFITLQWFGEKNAIMCLALVNLFTVSTVLYWDQKENTAHLGKYSTVEINTAPCQL